MKNTVTQRKGPQTLQGITTLYSLGQNSKCGDGGLQSAFQLVRMTGTENKLPVRRRRASRRGA